MIMRVVMRVVMGRNTLWLSATQQGPESHAQTHVLVLPLAELTAAGRTPKKW